MIEHHIKKATCRVSCGGDTGTGWLIAEDRVVTARHCVLKGIDEGQQVELFFPDFSDALPGKIIAHSEEWDSCLLSLEGQMPCEALPVSVELPREGETWETFGYPQGKPSVGHRLVGTVAQVLSTPTLKSDLDLSVDSTVALQAYQGFSGAVVFCQGRAVGMIRLKIDGTILAVSLHRLEDFFAENDVAQTSHTVASAIPLLAGRGDFPEVFAEAVKNRSGKYLFLEGAHGYGKSTFCESFQSEDNTLINLGAYRLSDPSSSLGANYRAQPQVFLDWLTTTISGYITGQAPRKEQKSYAQQIQETVAYIEHFSKFCAQSERRGMFFIDGLNEIPEGALLGELLGLLPVRLPANITIVLTAPNHATVAEALAGRVKTKDLFQLPPLPDPDCYHYCQQALKLERRSSALIDLICGKAKGHPLYLKYLIEYANHQVTDSDLSDCPVLTGPIEDYYQGIWSKLLSDPDAVSLLALIARLRWGISHEDFTKALNPPEVTQFVSVMSRIRHLLEEDGNTAIYHASFAAFIVKQTAAIDAVAYRRLADFCIEQSGIRYCALNRVFHLMRADDNAVFEACDQTWFDTAVKLGVEPDTLIADIDDLVRRAAIHAPAIEFFRLTLLAQRISFRYDTLFAQSARLIAEALIVLGRPNEALQHVLRRKTIIVGLDDALQIAFLLHHHGYDDEALILLERVLQRIDEWYDAPTQYLHNVLELCSRHIQAAFLVRLAEGWNGTPQVMAIMEAARRACVEACPDDSDKQDMLLCPILAQPLSYFLTFKDVYTDIEGLKAGMKANGLREEFPTGHLQTLCFGLLDFENTVDAYNLSKNRTALGKIFSDIEELISVAEIDASLASVVANTLVRFGASVNVVEPLATKGGMQRPRSLKIKAKNGVDVNHEDLQACCSDWRVASFLDHDFCGPSSGIITGTGWLESIEHLLGALYCCDGRARRAKVDSDEVTRAACLNQLKLQVLNPLNFTLQQRVDWKDSYAIPENALPWVYYQLAELLSDCFPEKLPEWLDNLVEHADGQWGMYSEGFRASAFHVLTQLTREKPCNQLAPRLLALLRAWRDHVLRGVENRHELVPEILRMIPILANFGAKEEAEKLYQKLLAVSMGPTWYKEDQLGIVTEVLNSIAVNEGTGQRLPQVAGYLERASGEMTFQRYVQAEKSTLIGQIARLGEFRNALRYFRRQCCGSTVELWAEAQLGAIDNAGPLQGNRYPGGGLDDQAAVLELARNSGPVSWALRWALLEIFHCGDSRHLTDYAEAFAKIANEAGAVPELIQRAQIVANAETSSKERLSFASAFLHELKPELHTAFETVLGGVPLPETPEPSTPPADYDCETSDDKGKSGLFFPGIIGESNARKDADRLLEEAEKQKSLGNQKAAKIEAVNALKAAQQGGWGIWCRYENKRAEEILLHEEVNATSVIRYYAPLIEAERYVPKWIPAQHLIGKAGPLLNDTESLQLLDVVIEHIRLVVGDSPQEIEAFAFLAEGPSEESADSEFFHFIGWLCNHPQWVRRNRAAAMLLWLVEQVPELLPVAVTTAFSMNEGYESDVLCGVLDGESSRNPVALWNRVADVLDVSRVSQEMRHVSRMVILERLASRAQKAGVTSAKSVIDLINASFTEKRGTGDNPAIPVWARQLSSKWPTLTKLVDSWAIAAWEKELEQLCLPLNIADALALEASVSTSFREGSNRPFDRWESKLRHSLNLALWPYVSREDARELETALRGYNPSQPERTVQGISNPFTDQLMVAIKSGDYSTVFGANDTVFLNYHDVVINPSENGTSHVEVLCLLQPASKQRGLSGGTLEQAFRSSELPEFSIVRAPFETCCQLKPEVVFFGSFTPAIPLPFFQNLTRAKGEHFIRCNWRYGRRNQDRGFGCPEREGCSLSIPRSALVVPSGFKLAWFVCLDGKIATFIDERNNRLI